MCIYAFLKKIKQSTSWGRMDGVASHLLELVEEKNFLLPWRVQSSKNSLQPSFRNLSIHASFFSHRWCFTETEIYVEKEASGLGHVTSDIPIDTRCIQLTSDKRPQLLHLFREQKKKCHYSLKHILVLGNPFPRTSQMLTRGNSKKNANTWWWSTQRQPKSYINTF